MPKSRHFGADPDTMQQVHGAGVKSNKITINFIERERKHLIPRSLTALIRIYLFLCDTYSTITSAHF